MTDTYEASETMEESYSLLPFPSCPSQHIAGHKIEQRHLWAKGFVGSGDRDGDSEGKQCSSFCVVAGFFCFGLVWFGFLKQDFTMYPWMGWNSNVGQTSLKTVEICLPYIYMKMSRNKYN